MFVYYTYAKKSKVLQNFDCPKNIIGIIVVTFQLFTCGRKDEEIKRDFFVSTKEKYEFSDIKESSRKNHHLLCFRSFGISFFSTNVNSIDYYEIFSKCSSDFINISGFIRYNDSSVYWIPRFYSIFRRNILNFKAQKLFDFKASIKDKWKCYLDKDSLSYLEVKLVAKYFYPQIMDSIFLFSVSNSHSSLKVVNKTIYYGMNLRHGFVYFMYENRHVTDFVELFPVQNIKLGITSAGPRQQ